MHAPILAFDCSAAHCAAALLHDDGPILRSEAMARGQAERLMPLLEEVLAEAGLSWGDLGAIGVGTGPGNFTGLRVAVSAARGLALGLGVPAMGVTGFEAAALDLPRPVTIALPAPRDHLWVQRLTEAGAETPQLLPASDAPEARPAPPPEALALAVARIAQGRAGTPQPRPAPFYIRAADAAPPREAPPPLIA